MRDAGKEEWDEIVNKFNSFHGNLSPQQKAKLDSSNDDEIVRINNSMCAETGMLDVGVTPTSKL